MSPEPIHLCIVGAGPRGTVALERVCANAPVLAPGIPVRVHVVDPYPAGGGRVWKLDQSRRLMMNTVAGDVTVFTDPSVECDGPLTSGPTQYQWAQMVTAGRATDVTEEAKTEAEAMLPWSYASRAFQGEYLAWAFRYIVGNAPAEVSVRVHRTRATEVTEDADGLQEVFLEGEKQPLRVDAVILAQGHYDVAGTRSERRLADFAARHGLGYVPPASPAEADLNRIPAGRPVVLRGLGLNFYDYLILLSEGRGGRFTRGADSRLRYAASGAEPLMYAGSGRGMPYRARTEIHKEIIPHYQPVFLTAGEISRLRTNAGTGRNDFMRDVFPLVAKEVAWVYYQALLKDRDPAGHARLLAEYPACEWGTAEMDRLVADVVPNPALRWDWEALDRPADQVDFADQAAFRSWILGQLSEDLRQCGLGPANSATKAATAVMRDLRNAVRYAISQHGISGESYRDHVDHWFSSLNSYAASGPPASRVEQLLALIEAGIVEPMGPQLRVAADEEAGVFLATSERVPGEPVRASALIEAHLPLTDIRRAADPLLRALHSAGGCRAHVIPDQLGSGYETGGLDVTSGTLQVIDAAGVPHPARFAYGPPIESVDWVTAVGARPHVNSRTLLQGDSIARSCLLVGARRLARDTGDHSAERALPISG
ncbi:FAD/NAD(P)-binding protein [Streptomyces sp. NPDC002588]|uniref:FAD/NAD(P)-binding protein n=1 Tax=Streptomyces sp. NPDC002588 TaxID=3154419 RepID=UPI00332D98D1